jgi:malonyl-CoA decarboxylase
MAVIFPKTLLDQSLRNIRKLWGDLLPRTWRKTDAVIDPSLPPAALESVTEQMRECLAARGGEVSARMRAVELGNSYLQLDETGRERFLTLLAGEFSVDREKLTAAIRFYQESDEAGLADAENMLRETLVSPRIRLLTQFNDLPDGTKFLVNLRTDLLTLVKQGGALGALDSELKRLLSSWFDVGFLELRRIDWSSPASLLEKLIAYEAVHEIESWDDLRNRLETDRCCYAFFHHHMPGEPLIFVEVALTQGIASNIQNVLDENSPEVDPATADTAIFYSISNTQRGLRGISFGSFLIKRVVDDLKLRFPNLERFVTLSPIPGFGKWLAELPAEQLEKLLSPADRDTLNNVMGAETPSALQGNLVAASWWLDSSLAAKIEGPIMKLCAHYLVKEKRGLKPLDPVARFHLGNGARIEQINWLGNTSPNGQEQSAGMMVNYAYLLGEIEKNHEGFVSSGEISISPEVKRLLRK